MKRISYGDLTLPRWVVGQLMKTIQIKDRDILRSVFNQIIFAMRDASSLPWPTVRAASASSVIIKDITVFINTTVFIVGNKVGHIAIQRQNVISRVLTGSKISSRTGGTAQDHLDIR